MEVEDLTEERPENTENNFWNIEQPYPTKAEVITLKNALMLLFFTLRNLVDS